MTNQLIAKINGSEIVTVDHEGETLIPIKPICQALGIADNKQKEKIKEDEILSSVGTLRVSTGADGKEYEMFCLPLRYVYGWLFTINPKNVAPDAREAVTKYRRECYEVLYDHFQQTARRAVEQAQAEAALLSEKLQFEQSMKECKAQMKRIDADLARLQSERLNPQPTIF